MSVSVTTLGYVDAAGRLFYGDLHTHAEALNALAGLEVVITVTAKHKPKVQP